MQRKKLGKLQRVGGHDGDDDDVGRLCNCQNTQQPARRTHNLKILVRFYFCNSMSLVARGRMTTTANASASGICGGKVASSMWPRVVVQQTASNDEPIHGFVIQLLV